jgi:hypothetical protein
MTIVPIYGQQTSPKVMLAQILEIAEDIDGVIIIEIRKRRPPEISHTAMDVADFTFAATALQVIAQRMVLHVAPQTLEAFEE